jgi:hypothetical protein
MKTKMYLFKLIKSLKLVITFMTIVLLFPAPTCKNNLDKETTQTIRDATVAFSHAPIHYQDTDSDRPKADYLVKFNYDNNWKGNDNWDNLNNGDLTAQIYYSVVETETHWFIAYIFFHPQDWDDVGAPRNEHENDLEGFLAICRKDVGKHGRLEAIITQAHGKWNTYFNESSTIRPLDEGRMNRKLIFRDHDGFSRVVTTQESKGHGCYAYGFGESDFQDESRHDGIVYYPHLNQPEIPGSGWETHVNYGLIDICGNQGLFEKLDNPEQAVPIISE